MSEEGELARLVEYQTEPKKDMTSLKERSRLLVARRPIVLQAAVASYPEVKWDGGEEIRR